LRLVQPLRGAHPKRVAESLPEEAEVANLLLTRSGGSEDHLRRGTILE
jgi:hypothetical protein